MIKIKSPSDQFVRKCIIWLQIVVNSLYWEIPLFQSFNRLGFLLSYFFVKEGTDLMFWGIWCTTLFLWTHIKVWTNFLLQLHLLYYSPIGDQWWISSRSYLINKRGPWHSLASIWGPIEYFEIISPKYTFLRIFWSFDPLIERRCNYVLLYSYRRAKKRQKNRCQVWWIWLSCRKSGAGIAWGM